MTKNGKIVGGPLVFSLFSKMVHFDDFLAKNRVFEILDIKKSAPKRPFESKNAKNGKIVGGTLGFFTVFQKMSIFDFLFLSFIYVTIILRK